LFSVITTDLHVILCLGKQVDSFMLELAVQGEPHSRTLYFKFLLCRFLGVFEQVANLYSVRVTLPPTDTL